MPLEFHAAAIHSEQTEGHILVGLADDAVCANDYVVLMRRLPAATTTRDAATSSVYFEYGGETMSGHGCLRSVVLSPDRATIVIDRKRCRLIPHAEIVITFDPRYEMAGRLPELLAKLLDGTQCLTIAP